jgi:hypothetical protein
VLLVLPVLALLELPVLLVLALPVLLLPLLPLLVLDLPVVLVLLVLPVVVVVLLLLLPVVLGVGACAGAARVGTPGCFGMAIPHPRSRPHFRSPSLTGTRCPEACMSSCGPLASLRMAGKRARAPDSLPHTLNVVPIPMRNDALCAWLPGFAPNSGPWLLLMMGLLHDGLRLEGQG